MLFKSSPTRLRLRRLGIRFYMPLHLHSSMAIPPLLNRYTIFLVFVLFSNWVYSEDDVRWLKGVKNSLTDPEEKLSSWSFLNTSAGFTYSLQYCTSLQTLDLSDNRQPGSIPPQIYTWIPYLVNLDLPRNDLNGGIPVGLVNCTYPNNLILDDKKLSGNIPDELSNLERMKKLLLENNDLSERVLAFKYESLKLNISENSGLCSRRCGLSKESLAIIISARGCLGTLFNVVRVMSMVVV
ncbi:unnamed protein product [Fraxinus pennsylvanica]|uniref:Uncharacterized protein n=1 Tax=Fraxinus pennsylvanica TaxID=56036 RepID=A0AAD1YZ50_9LAMI|nr:unnamed protein product [Fraxinus pennsylvanica]